MATAIAAAAPTGALPVGDFGTDAYARFPRDIVLNNTHRSGSPTERVYWYLCHASVCGPHVRTGCYLRNRRGFVQTDDAGLEIPVRQKDIGAALGMENRSIVQKAIQRLVSQNRLVVRADGVFCPVMDPDVLAKLRADESVPGSDAAPRPKRWMNVPLPDDYWDCPPEVQEKKYAYLKSLKDDCDAECAQDTSRIRERYRSGLKQQISVSRRDTSCIPERYNLYPEKHISTGPIIIDEEIEDIRLVTHTQQEPSGFGELSPVCVPDEVSSDPPEAPPPPAVPPNALIKPFGHAESWACFWSVYSGFSDSRQEEAKRWWFRHVRSAEYAVEVMEGLLRWKASDRWSRGIVQHAVNFLKNHEYRESPAPKKAASKREEVKDRLMEWADARDRAKEQRNGGGT